MGLETQLVNSAFVNKIKKATGQVVVFGKVDALIARARRNRAERAKKDPCANDRRIPMARLENLIRWVVSREALAGKKPSGLQNIPDDKTLPWVEPVSGFGELETETWS